MAVFLMLSVYERVRKVKIRFYAWLASLCYQNREWLGKSRQSSFDQGWSDKDQKQDSQDKGDLGDGWLVHVFNYRGGFGKSRKQF
jgi:hypothetical protein